MLSGDTNIANGLDGSGGAPAANDNDVFFLNLLQGGNVVRVLSTSEGSGGAADGADLVIHGFYGGQPGITSSLISGAVTSGDLAASIYW